MKAALKFLGEGTREIADLLVMGMFYLTYWASAVLAFGAAVAAIGVQTGGGDFALIQPLIETALVVVAAAGVSGALVVMSRSTLALPVGGLGALAFALFGWQMLSVDPFYALAALPFPVVWLIHRYYQRHAQSVKSPVAMPDDNLSRAQRGEERLFAVETPAVSFADVIGMDDLKERLRQAAHEIMRSSKSQRPRNGILLFGDPGNGKTFFTEALAGELQLPILSVSVGDVASRWVNQTPQMVRQLFQEAREQAPCVLFLDEVDSLLVSRADVVRSDSEESKVTNTLLREIVETRKSRVVIVAATNLRDKLDAAATREGRFDFKVEITPPDRPAREGLLRAATQKNGVAIETGALAQAAKRWDGFSVARINTVVGEAVRSSNGTIDYAQLRKALRTIQGRAGQLPENTPTLDVLTFSQEMRENLNGLAARLGRIEEIEALGGSAPKGVLFSGPPGTGKTLTARALAKTAGWAFLATSGNKLLSDPDELDKLVREAKDIKPAIVFIDEADDILRDRQFSAQGVASLTNKLLAAIDGSDGGLTDVVWIAATNYPEALDSAALRGGRFTEKIDFQLPDRDVLIQFVNQWLDDSVARFARETIEAAPDSLAGLALADVNEVLAAAANRAAERAVIRHACSEVTPDDLGAARSRVVG